MVGRLGYENLPTLAIWRADTYLSLSAAQKQLTAERLEALHAWHRRTQLDDYVAFLRDVQRHVATGDVDEARIRAWRQAAVERWRPIADRAAPSIAEVATTLEPAQLETMREQMERDNRKMRREWMPADRAARVDARTKRYVERAENFLGSLTAEQRQLARRFASEAPEAEEQWYARRLQRQRELVSVMERIRGERPDEATAGAWMREHLLRYAPARDASGGTLDESTLAASDAMSAAMLASATPRQRQHLQRKLQEWIELVESVRPTRSAQGRTPVGTAAN